jgi:poly-gamma-glutamate synthesis protein (capsule biosynthesis protein)
MKVLVAGDFCPQKRVADLFEQRDYISVLGDLKPIIQQVDYSIVNFECPVCHGGEKPTPKCGPNLQCTESGIEAVKWAGFDCVTLANNHFLDYGKDGVENTIRSCRKYGLDYVGGGMSLYEASQILYKEIEGKTLAIINCCEHEFSIATDTTAGSNPLNPIQQYYAIKEARSKADYVLVIVHGGHEHYQLPSPRMQETYRFFVDAGADAVINHHQHCYSGYEIYKGKPIFYGLGNFCFDWKNREEKWYWGIMVELTFDGDNVQHRIMPYSQCLHGPIVLPVELEKVEKSIKELNSIINDRLLLGDATTNYYHENMRDSNLMLEPISNRYIRALQSRHFLPKYHFGRKYLLRLYNFLMCEAHRDKIYYFLKRNIETSPNNEK